MERTSPAPAHLQQGATRPLLAGDALLQARVKAALDNVKLALHDFKEELHDTAKLGGEVAGLRGDLAGLRAAWEQQALASSEKLHQKLEAALTTTLSSTLAQLGSTASPLTSSLTSIAISINDSETRSANLLSSRFASLQGTQSMTIETVRTLESHLLAELQKVKSDVLSELEAGFAGGPTISEKLDVLSKGMGEVLARQQRILDSVELGKGSFQEVEALKDRLDRLEKEKEEDRQTFTTELTSISATLSPLASSVPQLTALLRASNHHASRAPSFDSYGAPPPAQPHQQRAASSLGVHSLGEGSLELEQSLGSTKGAADVDVGVGSRRSTSQSRRSNDDRSKTLSPPEPTPRSSTFVAHNSRAPASILDAPSFIAPANIGSTLSFRSSTTPPDPLDRTSQLNLSPPHGPSTQALRYEPSPSPAATFGPSFTMNLPPFGPFVPAVGSTGGGQGGATSMSSSAPAMMLGGGERISATTSTSSGGSGRRNKRRILQEDEEDEEDKPEEFEFSRYVVEETPEEKQSSSKRSKKESSQHTSSVDISPAMDDPLGEIGDLGDLSSEEPDTQ